MKLFLTVFSYLKASYTPFTRGGFPCRRLLPSIWIWVFIKSVGEATNWPIPPVNFQKSMKIFLFFLGKSKIILHYLLSFLRWPFSKEEIHPKKIEEFCVKKHSFWYFSCNYYFFALCVSGVNKCGISKIMYLISLLFVAKNYQRMKI